MSPRLRLIAAAALLPLAGAASGRTDDPLGPPLSLESARTLTFDRPIGRIEVEREGIVDVRAPSPRSLKLMALGVGRTDVAVYAADGALLAGGGIVVTPPRSAAADAIAEDPSLSRVAAVKGDEGVVLTGSVPDLAARVRAERIAGTAGEGAVTNAIDVAGEQMVAVDVQFAAVSASTLKALGFNFARLSGDIQGAIVSPSTLDGFSFNPGLSLEASAPLQNAFNLFLAAPNRGIGAVLSALSSTGLSQLLAQPTLMVRSGDQANFLAGGEIPIPIPQATGSGGGTISIEYKEFGVRLSVAPFVLSSQRIILKIAPEVSELDYANGVQLQGYTVPGIRRRSAETTVQLASGQSFVIAGLTYDSSSVTREKTPLIGDIPILGALFKRQQNQKERQELIIVATPRLVGPMQSGAVPALPSVRQGPPDPSIGDMIVGTDGVDGTVRRAAPFGVVRR